jgi:hypothetical protein
LATAAAPFDHPDYAFEIKWVQLPILQVISGP